MKLTDAQIYTLRRMASGTKYQLRGDEKCGRECRTAFRRGTSGLFIEVPDYISCPSLRPLLKAGLIQFVFAGDRTPTQYHAVELTIAGRGAATIKTSKEKDSEQGDQI